MRSNLCTWGYALLQLVAVVVVVLHVREDGLVGAALAIALTGTLFGAWAELRNPGDRRQAEVWPVEQTEDNAVPAAAARR
ncbi:hypothetical protein [Saccharothrix deserti]|uniref:hypothetical protein n=1 Tax=Saccharothrix deserti TaxID=2593674 RepID=UPI00131C2E14|nr:hypothetical protein [Saccharothrix deserti]